MNKQTKRLTNDTNYKKSIQKFNNLKYIKRLKLMSSLLFILNLFIIF